MFIEKILVFLSDSFIGCDLECLDLSES
jgi:hypothetical protein